MGGIATYNFVNSVKGGVGKTALSVLLAYYMEQVKGFRKNLSGFNGEIMLLDFDLQGTAMKKLFYGTQQEPEGYVYLDEIIMDHKKICGKAYKNELGETSYAINAIFSNDSMETKLLYRVGAKNNYSSAVTYDLFRNGVWRTLQGLRDEKYNHFIFDMPPNFDGFASAGIETICKEKEKHKTEEKMLVNMFFETGMDEGQIMVTLEEVKNMMTHEEHFIFDNLFIVFNDIIEVEGVKDAREVIKGKVPFWRDTLFRGITETDKKHIFIMYMPYNIDYARFNREGTGLRHLKISTEDGAVETYEKIEKVLSVPPLTNIWDMDGKRVYDFESSNLKSTEKLLELMLQDKE